MRLPRLLSDWPRLAPDAWEDYRERAAIVWCSDAHATEADWPAAKAAAERIVRSSWAALPRGAPGGSLMGRLRQCASSVPLGSTKQGIRADGIDGKAA